MAAKTIPAEITVAWELANRNNCRAGLSTVTVKYRGVPYAIEGSAWAERGRLVVHLQDGPDVSPDNLVLASPWPIYCCQPGKWHDLNRNPGKRRK